MAAQSGVCQETADEGSTTVFPSEVRQMRMVLLVLLSLAAQPAVAASDQPTPHSKKDNETLSEKLDRNKGVITPPADIDPGAVRPAPEIPNATPVIPPRAPGAK